jgi:UDP-glucuronate decarboxylase
MIRLMQSPDDFTGPVNIGNPTEFSMIELAELVLRLVGSSSTIVFMPLPQDDPRQRRPDISLAKSKLGWQPAVSLEDGLKETIAYFRRRLLS